MEPFLVLPLSGGPGPGLGAAAGIAAAGRVPMLSVHTAPAAGRYPEWSVSTTAPLRPVLRLIGPNDQAENEEEDQDDLELESDEDPTKLRSARARVVPDDGSTAARDKDGTINPSFP